MSLALAVRKAALAPGKWVSFPSALWRRAKAAPSLDLRFADNKSLVDAVTGQNLVTFTRASSGTFVGSDGLIKTATTNLITHSQTFNNAAWILSGTGATITAVTDIEAPNGSMTAWTLASGAGGFAQIQNTFSGISGATYTGSFWVRGRSGTTGVVSIRVSENINTQLTGITSSWQRFSFTATSTSTTIRLGIHLSANTESIDIWGAQLEQSSTVGEYIPTTSVINSAPRFDHNPTTGESLGLLVEEQRTNVKTHSEAILVANSYGANSSTLAAASIANPFGGTTASLFTLNVGANTGNNTDGFNFGSGISIANSTAHAQSLFVKPAGATVLRLRSNVGGARFDFTLIGNGTAPSPSADLQSAAIVPFPNGWYRVSWTFTSATSAPGNRGDYWTIKTNVADGTNGLYVVGAQLEAGAFPTSYIPTTTATATRSADVASITGANFSSWYNQTEGTVFADIVGFSIASSQFPRIVEFSDGTSNNIIRLQQYSSNLVRTSISTGSVGQMGQDGGTIAQGVRGKVALAVATDNCAFVVNAGTPSADSSVTVPVVITQATIAGTTGGTSISNSTINRLTYWPQRLSNTTLQEVTR